MGREKKKKNISAVFFVGVQVLIGAAVLAVIALSIVNVSRSTSETGSARLDSSVRQAVLACYAAEGMYPENIQYLTDHYGLQIDSSKYSVMYTIFGENIMPDITVTEKAG